MAPATTQIALLRAINLAGHNRVAMADLRGLMTDLGLQDPRTLLQSGNVVYSARTPAEKVERQLETEAKVRLSLDIDFVVRTAVEWRALVEANPFPKEAKTDPGHLLVMCLKGVPTAAAVKALRSAIKDREQVQGVGRALYITYPDGIGRSRLTSTLIERALSIRGTARNWNTVLKIAALAGVAQGCRNGRLSND